MMWVMLVITLASVAALAVLLVRKTRDMQRLQLEFDDYKHDSNINISMGLLEDDSLAQAINRESELANRVEELEAQLDRSRRKQPQMPSLKEALEDSSDLRKVNLKQAKRIGQLELKVSELKKDLRIALKSSTKNYGDIHGGLVTTGNVVCGKVMGSVKAGGNVKCKKIMGNVFGMRGVS